MLAVRTPLGFVVNVDTAMWARDHWLVVAEVWKVIILVEVGIVVPIFVAIIETRHRKLRDR
jgi:hypothetical protein